jgi:hypothetical protein
MPECVFGAAQEMVNNAGRVEPGFAYCPTAPEAARARCFEAVGAMAAVLHPDGQARVPCAKAAAYESACLRGAGLA